MYKSEKLVVAVPLGRGVMTYGCTECAYKSSTRSNVATHAMLHTGEKPHACRVCDYATHISSNLTKHERTHIGAPASFVCTLCTFETVFTKDFQQHQKQHVATGELPSGGSCDATAPLESHATAPSAQAAAVAGEYFASGRKRRYCDCFGNC